MLGEAAESISNGGQKELFCNSKGLLQVKPWGRKLEEGRGSMLVGSGSRKKGGIYLSPISSTIGMHRAIDDTFAICPAW